MQKNNYDSFTSIENDDKLTCPKLDLVDTNDNSTDSNSTSYQDENIIVQEVTTKRSSFFTIFSPAYRVFNYFSRHPLNTLLEVDKSGEDSFTDTTIIEDQATVNGEQIQIHDGEGKVLDVVGEHNRILLLLFFFNRCIIVMARYIRSLFLVCIHVIPFSPGLYLISKPSLFLISYKFFFRFHQLFKRQQMFSRTLIMRIMKKIMVNIQLNIMKMNWIRKFLFV